MAWASFNKQFSICGERKLVLLGIEIGGTKLQLGLSPGGGEPMVRLERIAVPPGANAEWIRNAILPVVQEMVRNNPVRAVGVGFGGPIDPTSGSVVRSHQVSGWDGFPLRQWLEDSLGLPVAVGNDADCAGLAEALFGAGRGFRFVFYTNVGSGIGGAIIINGQIYSGSKGIAGEIGHLRPDLCDDRQEDVEARASGWAIANWVRRVLLNPGSLNSETAELLRACGGKIEELSTEILAKAAREGSRLAQQAFEQAALVYGWAIAQAVTLLAPEVVVVGGGVAQAGEEIWFRPLRASVDRYVFPPLRGTFRIVPAALGQEVVVHGAIALAQQQVLQQG